MPEDLTVNVGRVQGVVDFWEASEIFFWRMKQNLRLRNAKKMEHGRDML